MVRVQQKHVAHVSQGLSLSSLFEQPSHGSKIDQFRGMLQQHIKSRLDVAQHERLVRQFFAIADVNLDEMITLSEARTLWSLIQQHEFFLLSILNDNDKLLHRGEFCGDVYTVEYLPLKPLTSQNLLQNFLPASMPVWKNRAKIVLSLLEFVEDIYQLDSLGSFYMCSLVEKSLGYSEDYEVKILDISNMLPYEEIRTRLQKKPCEHDQDCHIFEHCTSKCDLVSKLCTGELTHPTNLRVVCSVLRLYLLTSAPQPIERHLHELLSRCLALNSSMPDVVLEHAIVLSELKSVLWHEISY